MYMPAHVGSAMSAVADAVTKAYLSAEEMEKVCVGKGAMGTAVRWEVRSTYGTWAVLDRPIYRMAKERHRVWQCHLVGMDVVSDVAVRMGRVKEEVDEVDVKLAKMGIAEEQKEVMRAKREENVRS